MNRGLVWAVPVRATIVAHTEELIVLLDKIVAVLKKHDRASLVAACRFPILQAA
jgi:hypothetical protein